MPPIAIRGNDALTDFRATWTGERVLDLLQEYGGKMRVDWSVGAGKSHNIDHVIATAIDQQRYDLVIALFPTRQVIDERTWIHTPPPGVRVVNFRPRPSKQCGNSFNTQWQHFEQHGLGAVGRAQLCMDCKYMGTCFWPTQYGNHLAGTQVLFATQTHLIRDPGFVERCAEWAKASRVLVILDEALSIMASQERTIALADIECFLDVLEHHTPKARLTIHQQWIYQTRLLTQSPTSDLRAPDWSFPFQSPDWSHSIQNEGWIRHGERFRYIAPALQLFGRSSSMSRERLTDGTLRFAVQTDLSGDFLIYSAQTPHALTTHRLGQDYASPFANYHFSHPGTTWYNLSSRLGMQCYFTKNAPQILDFFAQLIVQRQHEGQRVLCIAKKRLIPLCATQLQTRLAHFGSTTVRVVNQPAANEDISDINIIPIIGYGAIGTNRYEYFNCVYCLTGFYVTEQIVSNMLQDQRASDFRIPISIRMAGMPPRRIAEPTYSSHRIYDVATLAQVTLDHLEMGTVLQAIGRIRPFTQQREVITFQCAAHPTDGYDKEFTTLDEMRKHFGLVDRRTAKGQVTANAVQDLQAEGLPQSVIATQLGISLRTVQRHWQSRSTPLLKEYSSLKESCRLGESRP